MVQRLRQEVERLEAWAAENDPVEYPHSGGLYAVVTEALDLRGLAPPTFDLLLRALTLDDDAETIQDLLRERPDKAERVAAASVSRAMDYRARWQVAVLAGEFAHEVIVRKYLSDDDEYVRRRAHLASRERFPELAETVALSWLDSSEPYSRMVALDTLHALGSAHYAGASAQLAGDDADVVRLRIQELAGAPPNQTDV